MPYLFVMGPYIRWRLLLFSTSRLNLQNQYSWDSFLHAVGTRYKTPLTPCIHDSRLLVHMPTSRSFFSEAFKSAKELGTKAKGAFSAIAGGLTAWNLTMFQRQKTLDRLKTLDTRLGEDERYLNTLDLSNCSPSAELQDAQWQILRQLRQTRQCIGTAQDTAESYGALKWLAAVVSNRVDVRRQVAQANNTATNIHDRVSEFKQQIADMRADHQRSVLSQIAEQTAPTSASEPSSPLEPCVFDWLF